MNNSDTGQQSTIETELLAHRLRLEQAKAAMQILPTSIECLARSYRAFLPDQHAPQAIRRVQEAVEQTLEYISEILESEDRLHENIGELLKDAAHVLEQLDNFDEVAPAIIQINPIQSAKIISLYPDKNPLANH